MTLETYDELLCDTVDIHIHITPDYTPRLVDDLEVATLAASKGMRAIVLKGHISHSADRAFIVQARACTAPAGHRTGACQRLRCMQAAGRL